MYCLCAHNDLFEVGYCRTASGQVLGSSSRLFTMDVCFDTDSQSRSNASRPGHSFCSQCLHFLDNWQLPYNASQRELKDEYSDNSSSKIPIAHQDATRYELSTTKSPWYVFFTFNAAKDNLLTINCVLVFQMVMSWTSSKMECTLKTNKWLPLHEPSRILKSKS